MKTKPTKTGPKRSPVTVPGYRAAQAPPNKGRTFPAEPLNADEVKMILAAISARGHSGIRNKALLCVLWRGGLRVTEALSLYTKDVDLQSGAVSILHGKGDRRRTSALDPMALAVLQRWLDHRSALGLNGKQTLFCTLHGKPLHASYVRTMLGRIARKANVEKRVTPHTFRHSFACDLMQEGTPINVISQALGHSSVATTSRYLSHIRPEEVISVLTKRTW
jgi:integrase/recombinase XerD